ncbi:chaperonin 10-like protein [Bisporella sp. PMI_857]|nr:chaperonin 10-like protein [Bisporella sp. PMI_857]
MAPARLINSLPSVQTAIVQGENGALTIQHDIPVPEIRPDHILVKVSCVGLNPCDWKMPERFPTLGCVGGCDFSGTVVALGSDISKTGRFGLGDRVCGAVHGANPIDKSIGTFSDYVLVDALFAFSIPPYMGFEEAVAGGSGVAFLTMGLVLRKSLNLPGSFKNPAGADESKDVLVYAASTSIGTLATQLLKLLSFGEVKMFDYHSPTCAKDICAYTKNSLEYIIDPMAEAQTTQLCYAAMGRAGGKYCTLEAYNEELCTRKVVKPQLVMGMSIFGKKVALNYGYERDADAESRMFGIAWCKEVQELLDSRKLKTHPVQALTSRYQGILKGLNMLKQKQISGQKLVVQLE